MAEQLDGILYNGKEYSFPKTDAYTKDESDAKFATNDELLEKLDDAPKDGNAYVRKDGEWTKNEGADLPISKEGAMDEEEEFVIANEAGEELVSVKNEGLVAKDLYLKGKNAEKDLSIRDNITKTETDINRLYNQVINSRKGMIRDGVKPLKIGFFGNSFSSVQVSPVLSLMLNELGIKNVIGGIYVGGGTIGNYYNTRNATSDISSQVYLKYKDGVTIIKEADGVKTYPMKFINDEDWDIISFQQGSAHSGVYSTYTPYFEEMVNWKRQHEQIPSKTMWFMPWCWADFKIQGGDIPWGGATSNTEMYSHVVNATKSLLSDSGDKIDLLSLCGVSVEHLRNDFSYTERQIWSDGQHLTSLGVVSATIAVVMAISKAYDLNITLNDIQYKTEYRITETEFNDCKLSYHETID